MAVPGEPYPIENASPPAPVPTPSVDIATGKKVYFCKQSSCSKKKSDLRKL